MTIFLMLESTYKKIINIILKVMITFLQLRILKKFQIRVKHALHTYKTKGEFKNSVF